MIKKLNYLIAKVFLLQLIVLIDYIYKKGEIICQKIFILKDRVVKIHAVQMVVAVMVAKLEIAAKVVAVTGVAVIQKIVAKRDKLISKIVCNLKFCRKSIQF